MDAENPTQVGLGCHVVVELIDGQGRGESLAFDLVPDEAADFARGFVSATSPLGQSVRGKFAGDEVDYRMGDVVSVRIVSVGPAQQEADAGASTRRQAVLDQARRKAERTNADMFASSFSGKWGNYDTQGMDDIDD